MNVLDKFSSHEEVEVQLTKVIQQLKNAEMMYAYQFTKNNLKEDVKAQEKILDFQQAKDRFAEVEAYGRWAPDYEEKRLKLVEAQKLMNHEETVRIFKQKEKDLGDLLDQLSIQIFRSVIPEVPIDFQSTFQFGRKSGGCSCKTGCKCKQ